MKTYDSKDAIYKDFAIALKFGLERPIHPSCYDELFKAFARDCRARISQFPCDVGNYQKQYPVSTGFFVKVPAKGDTGQDLGVQFILLEHETGWEIFIPYLIRFIAWLGSKVADDLAEDAINAAMKQVLAFMKTRWLELIHGGVRIDHVEIRTENKGVMRIRFSKFQIDQVSCLLRNFYRISHLRDCNGQCFNGNLVLPPASSSPPQSAD